MNAIPESIEPETPEIHHPEEATQSRYNFKKSLTMEASEVLNGHAKVHPIPEVVVISESEEEVAQAAP